MLTEKQKSWALDQAIEIVKQADGDALPVADRLKRTYKRLLALLEDVADEQPAHAPKDGKDKKRTATQAG